MANFRSSGILLLWFWHQLSSKCATQQPYLTKFWPCHGFQSEVTKRNFRQVCHGHGRVSIWFEFYSMVSDSVLFASALNIILFCLLKRTWGAVSTQTIGSELTFTPIEWKFSAAVTFTPSGAWHSLIPKYSRPLHCVTARFPLSFPAYLIWGGMRTNSCTPTSHYSLVHGSLSYRSAFRVFQTSPARTLLHLLKNDLHLFDTCGLIKLTRYIDTI